MNKSVIIVAGGSGKRMKSTVPKQFITINNLPVLMHTINRFVEYFNEIQIVLVLPEKEIEYWKILCRKYNFIHDVTVVKGGASRFQSVKNGLKHITDDCIVGIHDGVRPLVSSETLKRSYEKAEQTGNAVPIIPIVASLRLKTKEGTKAVERAKYMLVQTPQVFSAELIKKAYKQPEKTTFTDDATVLESIGIKINTVEGNEENIKITTPSDIIIAEAMMTNF